MIRQLSPLTLIKTRMNLCVQEGAGEYVIFMVLYIDDILLIGDDVRLFSLVNIWLSTQFWMKDLGEDNIILGLESLETARIGNWCCLKLLI